MSNTSATGGYLTPDAGSLPPEDVALEDVLQSMVVGISGLPGQMVKPKWQMQSGPTTPQVPKQPTPNTDWCSYGITAIDPDANAAMTHVGTDNGLDVYLRHEEIEVLCTFYGPNSMAFASTLRDGIAIPQNMEALRAQKMAYLSVSAIRAVPEFVNQQWIRRHDILIHLRRQVVRKYPILNILSAETQFVRG